MLTVIETLTFLKLAADYWTEDDRGEFAAWIAQHPDAGDVIPRSGGCRKVRWARKGMGKRGGVRVIYFNRLANGEIWLLLVYAKNVQDNIPGHVLRQIKEEIEDAEVGKKFTHAQCQARYRTGTVAVRARNEGRPPRTRLQG